MSSTSFKVYCADGTIRRFSLTLSGNDGIFEKLKKALDERDIAHNKLYWVDEENDLITLTSDGDIREAIVLGGLVRLQIDAKSRKPTSDDDVVIVADSNKKSRRDRSSSSSGTSSSSSSSSSSSESDSEDEPIEGGRGGRHGGHGRRHRRGGRHCHGGGRRHGRLHDFGPAPPRRP